MENEQYHILPAEPTPPSGPQHQTEIAPSPPQEAAQDPLADDDHVLPPGVVAEDAARRVLQVPRDLVVDSPYRTRLPFGPTAARVQAAQQEIERSGYDPLPARCRDGRYEVLGHELTLDALRASQEEIIRVHLIEPESEVVAYIHGKRERVKHAGPPSHYELMRDVWRIREMEGLGITWTRVGELMDYKRSTVTHARRDAEGITPEVVMRAEIDDLDPEQSEQLRNISGKRLRWAAKGETPDDRAIRLSYLFRGTAPTWANPTQAAENQEVHPVSSVRTRKSRNGTMSVVAEIDLARATKPIVDQLVRDLRATIKEYQDEAGGSTSDE